MTGHEVEAVIETYLTNRGWRKDLTYKNGMYWRDPQGHYPYFWAEAFTRERHRENVEILTAKERAKGSAA